jgi:hypothetical protein
MLRWVEEEEGGVEEHQRANERERKPGQSF